MAKQNATLIPCDNL